MYFFVICHFNNYLDKDVTMIINCKRPSVEIGPIEHSQRNQAPRTTLPVILLNIYRTMKLMSSGVCRSSKVKATTRCTSFYLEKF